MNTKSTLVTVFFALIVVFASWLFSSFLIKIFTNHSNSQSRTVEAVDTTSIISRDLNQVFDDSVLDKQIESLDKELQNF